MVVQHLAVVPALGGRQLHRPQEVGDGLEVRPARVDFVDHVLNAVKADGAQRLAHHRVVADRDALARHLAEPPLVNDLLGALQVGVAVSDERLNEPQHLSRRRIDADEDAVVDLTKAQQLQDLFHLG